MKSKIALYARWWQTWKSLPVKPWVKAAAFYRGGSFREASLWYQKGLAQNPFHPARFSARVDLAFCLQKLGKLAEAKEHLRYVINNQPDFREAYLRLARLQLLLGHAVEASWTVRSALRFLSTDAELLGLYMFSAFETNSAPDVRNEALRLIDTITNEQHKDSLLKFCLLRREIEAGNIVYAWEELTSFIDSEPRCVEAMLYFSRILIRSQQFSMAKGYLDRALRERPDNPVVLASLAAFYLAKSEFFNAAYALQLAQSACQASEWSNPRALITLANAYFVSGDRGAALLVASRAKDVRSSLLEIFRDEERLESFIQGLSSEASQ